MLFRIAFSFSPAWLLSNKISLKSVCKQLFDALDAEDEVTFSEYTPLGFSYLSSAVDQDATVEHHKAIFDATLASLFDDATVPFTLHVREATEDECRGTPSKTDGEDAPTPFTQRIMEMLAEADAKSGDKPEGDGTSKDADGKGEDDPADDDRMREVDSAIATLEKIASDTSKQAEEARASAEKGAKKADGLEKDKEIEALLKQTDELIGAEDFKRLMHDCAALAPAMLARKVTDVFMSRCFLFSIREGAGLSTYLDLFGRLCRATGLMKEPHRASPVQELTLTAPTSQNPAPTENLVRAMQKARVDGVVVCIDVCEWMNEIRSATFRTFLRELRPFLGRCLIVFRIPFVEQEVLEEIYAALSDTVSVYSVSFLPFSHEQLALCAKQRLAARGFAAEEGVWEVFAERIKEEREDGRFYDINTINKVLGEMIYLKLLYNAAHGMDDSRILPEQIAALSRKKQDESFGLERLDEFVGMELIRTKVEEITAQVELSLKTDRVAPPCVHMRFVGNPGTGKTTVARVIGTIFKERGILRNGGFFEYTGRDLCGRFIGETAPKTAAICRDAYGSVLFIDEAYSLYRDGISDNDYGKEAIEALIAEMENHRQDLVVIMAGYPGEMETLMKANPGLESRMPYVINFNNYTREQLLEIFCKMAKKSFECEKALFDAARDFFLGLPDELLNSRDFANARFVRNLFERTWAKATLRCHLAKEEQVTLRREDFLSASIEKEFSKIMQKPKRPLGFY